MHTAAAIINNSLFAVLLVSHEPRAIRKPPSTYAVPASVTMSDSRDLSEDEIADLGDFRIGGCWGNHRNLRGLSDGRGFERAAGGYFTEDGDHTVAGDQLVDNVCGLAGL